MALKVFKDKIVVPENSLFCYQISDIDTYITNQNFLTSTILTNALAYYATLASPTFSGTVTLPNNQTVTSTTAPFLTSVDFSPYATKASPTFSGTVTLPNNQSVTSTTAPFLTSVDFSPYATLASPTFTGNFWNYQMILQLINIKRPYVFDSVAQKNLLIPEELYSSVIELIKRETEEDDLTWF